MRLPFLSFVQLKQYAKKQVRYIKRTSAQPNFLLAVEFSLAQYSFCPAMYL